ncbi:SUKH-4 family immunity protein [Kitasatospora arboriphila]
MNESEVVAAARRPTAAWLESCFGPGTVWRPTEAELPASLTNAGVRDFLTTVGVPAVRLSFVDWHSGDLPEKGMWAEDPDELYGLRRPDDDSPPACHAYCIGTYGVRHLMVRGDPASSRCTTPRAGTTPGATAARWLARCPN